MADGTKIEWTEATWNPITGCSLASPGCTNCYAMQLAGTRLKHSPSRKGLTQPSKAGPVWTGEVRFNEYELTHPLRWKRPRMIFVCAHGDLFHESVPDAWIDRIFAVMALCPQHTFQVLTKRSARMREYLGNPARPEFLANIVLGCAPDRWGVTGEQRLAALGDRATEQQESFVPMPLPNVWLGVSVEDQQRADERIPDLVATPAAVRWISAEPLLGPVDLTEWLICPNAREGLSMDPSTGSYECCRACDWTGLTFDLNWLVVGGESGSKARPMHPDWARSLRDQCAGADVPFFFKQWGEWGHADQVGSDNPALMRVQQRANYQGDAPNLVHVMGDICLGRIGKKRAGRLLDGVDHNGMPEQIASGANCSEAA